MFSFVVNIFSGSFFGVFKSLLGMWANQLPASWHNSQDELASLNLAAKFGGQCLSRLALLKLSKAGCVQIISLLKHKGPPQPRRFVNMPRFTQTGFEVLRTRQLVENMLLGRLSVSVIVIKLLKAFYNTLPKGSLQSQFEAHHGGCPPNCTDHSIPSRQYSSSWGRPDPVKTLHPCHTRG